MSGERRILVFGSTGQVASSLRRTAVPDGWRFDFLSRADADLGDPRAPGAAIAGGSWDAVVNAAAYTAVDRAESEQALAFAINGEAPGRMAAAAAARDIPLLHLSTDYVFSGDKETPYVEDDPVSPLGVYGASKEAGEAAVRAAGGRHAIIRTAWVFSPFGHNFVKTIMRLARERDRLTIVADQHGSPTSADDIAAALVRVLAACFDGTAPRAGTYHFCNAGATTWHGFAVAIVNRLAVAGLKRPEVAAIPTSAYPTPARRPANSVLDTGLFARTFDIAPRSWQAALEDCMADLLGDKVPDENAAAGR